jgi:uncharacterized membrane protein YkvA (DUF1232 family)
MNLLESLKKRAKHLRTDIYTLYFVARHPGTPWYAKLFIAGVVAYALSPIDLIPDFIPIIGYMDDLILVPLGIALAIKMVPDAIVTECRIQAREMGIRRKTNWKGGIAIILIWLALAGLLVVTIYKAHSQ